MCTLDFVFRSDYDLISVGKILSERIFCGVEFGGSEDYIHEELPCIYISKPFLGLRIELEGYNESDPEENKYYVLSFRTDEQLDYFIFHNFSSQYWHHFNDTVYNDKFREYIEILLSQIHEIRLMS